MKTQNQTMNTYGIYGTHASIFRSGIAGLNMAPEVPAMTMFRHIIFGAVIGVVSKSIFEEKK